MNLVISSSSVMTKQYAISLMTEMEDYTDGTYIPVMWLKVTMSIHSYAYLNV